MRQLELWKWWECHAWPYFRCLKLKWKWLQIIAIQFSSAKKYASHLEWQSTAHYLVIVKAECDQNQVFRLCRHLHDGRVNQLEIWILHGRRDEVFGAHIFDALQFATWQFDECSFAEIRLCAAQVLILAACIIIIVAITVGLGFLFTQWPAIDRIKSTLVNKWFFLWKWLHSNWLTLWQQCVDSASAVIVFGFVSAMRPSRRTAASKFDALVSLLCPREFWNRPQGRWTSLYLFLWPLYGIHSAASLSNYARLPLSCDTVAAVWISMAATLTMVKHSLHFEKDRKKTHITLLESVSGGKSIDTFYGATLCAIGSLYLAFPIQFVILFEWDAWIFQ